MKTAIIVDDEPITRMDFEDMLETIGFDVVAQGKDGFEAIELCKRYNPDLLLIDIKMPIFDGLSAAENIIRMKTAKCVILVTAYNDKEFIGEAKRIGVAGYVTKPVDERTLVSIIEIAMSQTNKLNSIANEAEKVKKQIKDKSLIDRAKMIMAKRNNILEGEAYSKIQKMSMNKGVAMVDIARLIIDSDDKHSMINKNKNNLRI